MMLRNQFCAFVFSLALFVAFTDIVLCQSSNLNGEQVVQKMAMQYKNAKSYQDTGVVTHLITLTHEFKEVAFFKTYFASPNKFRFEWEDKKDYMPILRHIVWSDGKNTFTHWESKKVEKEESLGSGIARATGVSSGSAHTVTSLLTQEIGGSRLTEMLRISLLREKRFEGTECFVVRGFYPSGEPIELWIGKKDFLLRKFRQQFAGIISEEVRRNIKLNETIPAETFQFNLPK